MELSGSLVAKKVVDAFLLREREKVVVARAAPQQDTISRCHRGAQARMRGARDLLHGEPLAALALYREAAVLLIAALGQASGAENVVVRTSHSEAWRDFDGFSRPATHAELPEDLARARPVLESDDPLSPDALPPEELTAVSEAAARTVAWLASTVEPRNQHEIRVTRGFRIAGVAVFVLFVLYEIGMGLFAPKNLALGKLAMASSRYPSSPPPSAINNGDIESAYGYQTQFETNPWIQIDLGALYPVHEVRVFNRGDGWFNEVLPIKLQVSEDAMTYTDVEERTEPFTRDTPWIAKLDGKPVRFVRVTQERQGHIALTEIEVY
jgi:F5/8 type C domain